jgi:hypothetical protein
MVGANPRFQTCDRAGRLSSSTTSIGRSLGASLERRKPRGLPARWRRFAILSAFAPLSLALVQCGQAPSAGTLAANVQPATGASFEDRFPKPQFKDRFPSASESLEQRQMADFQPRGGQGNSQGSTQGNIIQVSAQTAPQPAARPAPAPYRVASLEPQLPFQRPAARDDLTTLVSMKSSAFPYFGNNPASDAPFLNVSSGDRRGHRSYSGHVYWQDQTYNDSRVLVHIPENFDVQKPGVIVVFFHGNGATLERDVRDRQLLPQQISDSGANAVLLAPQLAVDAADSSAGKFWQPGGLKRFINESADHLAKLYGDPNAAKTFANMPIVIVGYSGGFVPTAWSLDVGGVGNRVRGVVLLDAVYGELDKFASWVANNRSGFFVSAYTRYTQRHDQELMQMIRDKGIAVSDDMDGPLRPGSVVFVKTPDGVTHRDYVTHAWTDRPVREVLAKMALTPALTRFAASNAESSISR